MLALSITYLFHFQSPISPKYYCKLQHFPSQDSWNAKRLRQKRLHHVQNWRQKKYALLLKFYGHLNWVQPAAHSSRGGTWCDNCMRYSCNEDLPDESSSALYSVTWVQNIHYPEYCYGGDHRSSKPCPKICLWRCAFQISPHGRHPPLARLQTTENWGLQTL